MDNPQPIATAPRDGTVIITDYGIACFMTPAECHGYWGHQYPDGRWVLCSTGGAWEEDSDYGVRVVPPSRWVPLPEWMK